jgi:hypothetical protein
MEGIQICRAYSNPGITFLGQISECTQNSYTWGLPYVTEKIFEKDNSILVCLGKYYLSMGIRNSAPELVTLDALKRLPFLVSRSESSCSQLSRRNQDYSVYSI